jgi:RecJ-like exonuclease
MNIEKITENMVGKKVIIEAVVDSVFQTKGPIIVRLRDMTGAITCKTFKKEIVKGIKKEQLIKATLTISVFNDAIEPRIEECVVLEENYTPKIDISKFDFKLNPISNLPKGLVDKIKTIAILIKQAIQESRPIFLRHHGDCDGYSGAIAMEYAITNLIDEFHKRQDMSWKLYSRAPSATPFYDYMDVTKDLAMFLDDGEKFDNKHPLVILLDLGSTSENIMSIKKLNVYETGVIIIDHHNPLNSKVNEFVDVFLNPYDYKLDSNLTAGMLGVEVARFLLNEEMPDYILNLATISGIGDYAQGNFIETFKQMSIKKGYDYSFFEKVAAVMDYEAKHLRFGRSRVMINDLVGKDEKKQKELVELIYEEIKLAYENQLCAVEKYSEIIDLKTHAIIKIPIDDISKRGQFPATGKITGLTLRHYKEKLKKPICVLGYMDDSITFRIDDNLDVEVNKLINYLEKEKKYSLIDGGGHEKAASLKFIKASSDEIMEVILDYLKKAKISK